MPGKNANEGSKATTFVNKVTFLNKIKPLLSFIVDASIQIESGLMVAYTGYYFIKFLNFMLQADAE